MTFCLWLDTWACDGNCELAWRGACGVRCVCGCHSQCGLFGRLSCGFSSSCSSFARPRPGARRAAARGPTRRDPRHRSPPVPDRPRTARESRHDFHSARAASHSQPSPSPDADRSRTHMCSCYLGTTVKSLHETNTLSTSIRKDTCQHVLRTHRRAPRGDRTGSPWRGAHAHTCVSRTRQGVTVSPAHLVRRHFTDGCADRRASCLRVGSRCAAVPLGPGVSPALRDRHANSHACCARRSVLEATSAAASSSCE